MAEGAYSKSRGIVASHDALAGLPIGTTLTVQSLEIGSVEGATAAPLDVKNWESFEGTLLAVCFKYHDRYVVSGSAVVIGLGLALSAKHVIDDHRDALMSGDATLVCFGMRSDGQLDIWQCYAMSTHSSGDGDLELLSLKLLSDIPADGKFMVLPLTTRIPPLGEVITIAGFRIEESNTVLSATSVTLDGKMYVSQGSAGEYSYPIHDAVLAPYPTIEIFSGSLGGMSGGAVLDVNGHVVGVISRGWAFDDQEGPTLAASWLPTYCWRLSQQTWPPGAHVDGAAIYEIPLIHIVGREYVQVLDEPTIAVTRW